MSYAQTIDPYARLTDPRAIARLAGPDAEPLRQKAGFGWPGVEDSALGAGILAQDSGAGIITHIWMAASVTDSLSDLRLYIDDSLIISSRLYEFFSTARGLIRAPLDSNYPGGMVCDVQIPYRKNFKITLRTNSNNYYYAIAWRPVQIPFLLTSFQANAVWSEIFVQQHGESRFYDHGSPWKSDSARQLDVQVGIRGGDTLLLADISGSGLVQTIHLQPDTYDRLTLDSIHLQMFWDGSPYLSVDVPFNDFFGAATGAWKNESLFLKVDGSDGLTSYFPMPFAKHALIRLINSGTNTVALSGFLRYDSEKIDPTIYGYFGANFSESNPTRLNIFHPVLHRKGRGRYIGMSWSIPNIPSPVALEGDPFIHVDSSSENLLHYTGSEDYLNGGWWFFGAPFSAPFSGFTHIFDSFYRFHVLDAVDYKYSIDFLLQHGVDNDVSDDYRTVAYYYENWTPFWVSRDTIQTGESWTVGGAGYSPHQSVQITLGIYPIATLKADSSGAFTTTLSVPKGISQGANVLWVNNVAKPDPIYVLAEPTLLLIRDSLPVTVRAGDTILVTGAGFVPGDQISLYLDSILVSSGQKIVVGPDYRFTATLTVPYLPEWRYHVIARGNRSGSAEYASTIHLVRFLDYEFENLVPGATTSGDSLLALNVSYYWHAKWSHQSFAQYLPAATDDHVDFQIFVPHSDTFKIDIFATSGKNFGAYKISLDGWPVASFDGYRKPTWADPWPSDTIQGGVWYLKAGTHAIQWTYTGKADSAQNNWLGADHITLTPITKLPLVRGTIIDTGVALQVPVVEQESASIAVYPNPAGQDGVTLHAILPSSSEGLIGGEAEVRVYDILGRVLQTTPLGRNPSTAFTLHLTTAGVPNGNYFCVLKVTKGTHNYIGHTSFSVER